MSFSTPCIRHTLKRRAIPTTTQRRNYAIPLASTSSSSSASGTRASSSNLPPSNAYAVFDRNVKKLQKDRSVRRDVEHSRLADYVKDEAAGNLVDRLLDIKKRYPAIVDFGSGAGHLIKHLDRDITQKVIMCDSSEELLYRDKDVEYDVDIERIVLDEEDFLHKTLQANSQDVIMSNLALHWINDLPGTLIQIRQVLKEDGVFIGALLGGDSLFELRTALQLAELEREGGISPRVSPMTDSRQMSSLLSRAGFSLPAVDVDEITINYPSIFELMDDLRFMGQSNAVTMRRHTIKRDTLIAADAIYRALHGNEDGTLPATFQIIFSIGWKPSASQPKPLKRGSAQKSLKEALDADGKPESIAQKEEEETPLAPDDSEGGKGSDAGGNAEDAVPIQKK